MKDIIKIKNINIINNKYIILSYNNIEFVSSIYKGNVNFNIFNEYKKQLSLDILNVNDIINIYYNNNNNNINIIKKIIIKYKYIFNNEY
jgi:hypothetical protein